MGSSMSWTQAFGPAMHAGSGTYRPDIDGLRAVAVLAVVLNHLPSALLPGGFVGVDVFFVISGYLITGIIGQEMAGGRFSFRRFYERRARRIFPALFFTVGATLAACFAVMLPTDLIAALQGALGALLFVANLVFWRMETGYFEEIDARTNPLLHTWSLGVEEQFYVLFPIFLFFCFRWVPRRIAPVLAACTVVSFAAAALLVRGNAAAAFYLSPFRAWELLAGALLAVGALPPLRVAALRELLVAGGLCAILAAALLYSETTRFPGASALLPVIGAMAVIQGGAGGSTLAGRLLSARPMVYVGLISYSLYLWHWPVIVLAEYVNGMRTAAGSSGPLLLVSVGLAVLSYHFVEQPWRRPALRRPHARGLLQAVAFVAGATVFCIAGLLSSGFPGRFDARVAEFDAARRDPLPYRECNDRHAADACRLGAPGVEPSFLLWGDSHLMAMAPVLHDLLLQSRAAAVFVPATGCAPLLDVDIRMKAGCRDVAASVRAYLSAQPSIKAVALAAFWSTYFREHGPLRWEPREGVPLEGAAAAHGALGATVQWLTENGRKAVIVGPVPTFKTSVPAALALQLRSGQPLLDLSPEHQREKNVLFARAAGTLPKEGSVAAIHPLDWMCQAQCTVMLEGKSLYRDAHHLNDEGARFLRDRLADALGLRASADPESDRPRDGASITRRGGAAD